VGVAKLFWPYSGQKAQLQRIDFPVERSPKESKLLCWFFFNSQGLLTPVTAAGLPKTL